MKQARNQRVAHSWQKKKKKRIFSGFKLRSGKVHISRRFLLITLAAGVLLWAIYASIFSGYMRIDEVVVSGNENISSDELQGAVKSVLAAPVFGFLPGDSYLFIDKGEIETVLLGKFAEMDDVQVELGFPKKLKLNVKEKKPALLWCRNECYFVNDAGTVFMSANEAELVQQKKHFIKIIEEAQIIEETAAERQAMEKEAGEPSQESLNGEGQAAEDGGTQASSVLPAISVGEKVADEGFIKFALDINNLVSHSPKVKVMYFKTKGYKTRELIGFTDKNTRLYFDATASAEKQAKNLDYLLNDAIAEEKADTLQYIYLKNEDRVFYK